MGQPRLQQKGWTALEPGAEKGEKTHKTRVSGVGEK
jgi:hypothetical protein